MKTTPYATEEPSPSIFLLADKLSLILFTISWRVLYFFLDGYQPRLHLDGKATQENEQKICAANILLSETGINSPPLDSVYTPTSAWHN